MKLVRDIALLFLLLLLSTSTGCMTSGKINKVVSALAKDPASIHLRVTSIYGVIEVTRTNPSTNTLPHTVSPDGTIAVRPAAP